MNEDKCILKEVEKRLMDSLGFWVEAKKSYFNPDGFRLHINSCIQSLRNVTFVLQSHKESLHNFDEWYGCWQEKMRADHILKWLVEARNHVVKQGDLETHSKLRVAVLESWFDPPVFEGEIPLETNTWEFVKVIASNIPKEADRIIGLLRAERRWVDSKLPDTEILEALSHVFWVLFDIVLDAHERCIEKNAVEECAWFLKVKKQGGTHIPCMMAQDWDRTIWLDLHMNEVLDPAMVQRDLTEDDYEKARKRYPFVEEIQPDNKKNKTLEGEAVFFFEQAKKILLTDGYHLPFAMLGYPNGEKQILGVHMENRTEKHLAFRQTAAFMEKTGASSIIFINEMWFAQGEGVRLTRDGLEAPNRQEALQLVAAEEGGAIIAYRVFFTKDDKGKVKLGKEFVEKNIQPYFLLPILSVWEKKKKNM